jgi:hypothetical protein
MERVNDVATAARSLRSRAEGRLDCLVQREVPPGVAAALEFGISVGENGTLELLATVLPLADRATPLLGGSRPTGSA